MLFPNEHLPILYQDEHIVAVDKPPGCVCHPVGNSQGDTLISRLRYYFGESVRLPHRLDKNTSGIVLAALTTKAVRSLYRQFSRRSIQKSYLALVYGKVKIAQQEICLPIANDTQSLIQIKMKTAKEGLTATTRYQVLQQNKSFSLLEVNPITGRKHQIRVHLAAIGHPIVGEVLYFQGGLPFLWEYYRKKKSPWHFNISGHGLHAHKLSLSHPVSKSELTIEAPIRKDFLIFED